MTDPAFAYLALQKADRPETVTSLIAYRAPATAPLEAVLWSRPRRAWISGPGLAARYLYDDQHQNRTRVIDRTEAERLAREVLRTELPTAAALEKLIEQGRRMGWEFGPPLQ